MAQNLFGQKMTFLALQAPNPYGRHGLSRCSKDNLLQKFQISTPLQLVLLSQKDDEIHLKYALYSGFEQLQ
jgi:hypothetical protein